MKYDNINILLEKYERGQCSDEESAIVESFLEDSEDNSELFESFVENEKNLVSSINVLDVLEAYQLSDTQDISDIPAYSEFINTERTSTSSIDVTRLANDLLFEKFEKGETNIAENREIDQILNEMESSFKNEYKDYIHAERFRKSSLKTDVLLQSDSNIVPIQKNRFQWKQLVGIAAILLAVFSTVFFLQKQDSSDQYVEAGTEIEDPEEALAFTMAMLGITSEQMKKGTDNLKLLDELKHTQIYK